MEPILCKNCKYCKDNRCTQFNFAADMRDEFPWCKSGEKKEEVNVC